MPDPNPTKDEDNRIHVKTDLIKDRPPKPSFWDSYLGTKVLLTLIPVCAVILSIVLLGFMGRW